MPRPVILGPVRISTRDVVILRLETNAGITGQAIGYTRGTPLLGCLEALSPAVLGRDAARPQSIATALVDASPPGQAQLSRAISLIDIALWDIAAKRAKMPLFELLGGAREAVPATAVAGYFLQDRDVANVVAEAQKRFDEGYARVKVMIDGTRPAFDRALCDALARLDAPLALDAHWTWRQHAPAAAFFRDIADYGFVFVEDPFPAGYDALTARLQADVTTPVAAGEDAAGLPALAALAETVGYLRVDTTTCGGVAAAVQACAYAEARGTVVFPHVFAPIHTHLACATRAVDQVEIIPSDVGSDPLDLVLDDLPDLKNGAIAPRAEAGNGIAINWDRAQAFVRGAPLEIHAENERNPSND
ncbi:mandelate racemase/muconate lactonizing enzyme family protein [Thalassococcus sp. S3]|uniref:mandelate racemase/muconate lactonizing enzyme family protein n=1 Tax=Thalassococcus sp. S3 TaxID=2017482 RepID=UPI00102477AE|nr:enolase C-terminal domain-like protein [Thalassococcus sp. S3]QBF30803.1 L-alanine-DL-glutamate epimerase [Thalassococcus sp. S3]